MWNMADLLDDLRGLRDDLRLEIDEDNETIEAEIIAAFYQGSTMLNSRILHQSEGRIEAFEQVLQQLEEIIEEYDDDADL